MQFYNVYRKGLRAFIIKTRDGHPTGYLWAQTRYAALNRASHLAGQGASAEFYGIDLNILNKQH